MEYNNYFIRSILANNQFGITEVSNLQSVKTISLIKEEYKEIESLIKAGELAAIKTLHKDKPRTGEYLEVLEFNDQNGKKYIVTVYDSDALEQDLQVIEIYSLA